jgi:flagella basal body P-ring formation protein FlgA
MRLNQTRRGKWPSRGKWHGIATVALVVPASLMMMQIAQADELAANAWPGIDALTRLTDAPQPAGAPAAASTQNAKATSGNGLVFATTDSDETQTTLEVKQSVMVDAPVIKLGDLFDQPITGGDTPIAQAPKPGQTMSLDARFLRQLARAYHLDIDNSQTFDHILVARKCQLIKSDTVTAAIVDAIDERTQQSSNMDVVFDTGEVQFILPTNVDATVAVQGLNFDSSSNRFLAILVVPATGPTLYTQQVVGTVYEKMQVPVLKHTVSPGDTIQADDVEWTSSRVDQLAMNAVTDEQQMIGRIARRPLRQGQILRMTDLINEPTMHKNDLITIAVQTTDMSLTVRGKALEDGAVGQTIRVMNVNTNKQLMGVVKDAATVTIQPAGPLAMN